MASKRKSILWAALVAFTFLFLAIPAFADSQVRIVRLSDVHGNVEVDRNTGQGFEKAFLNLPLTAGMKLRANADARAEVEFEDGSTVRLAPETAITFPQLSLRDSWARLSTVVVQQGMVYVNFRDKNKVDEFTVQFSRETAKLTQPTHFRLQADNSRAVLAVFQGAVDVEGATGSVSAEKKQTVTFELADGGRSEVAKNIEKYPLDTWDQQQEKYHDSYLRQTSSVGSPYAYGMSDLAYYGNFVTVPGYGVLWSPFFTDASWSPYMDGSWAWYPGYGYMWVSAYPWGWMPYRYGGWTFLPGYGWMWQPGNNWGAWTPVPVFTHPPRGFVPPHAPTVTAHNTIVMNRTPITVGMPGQSSKIVIRSGSAGLGIPRGFIHDLPRISQQVQRNGFVTAPVSTTVAHPTPVMTHSTTMETRDTRGPGPSSSGSGTRNAPSPSPSPSPRPSGPPPSSGGSSSSAPHGGSGPRR